MSRPATQPDAEAAVRAFASRAAVRRAVRAAAALALCAAPLAAQSRERTVVVGQLLDAETRAPLSGAAVRVLNGDIRTASGADGQFRLRLRPGVYNVALYHLGYETALETWEVGGQSLDVGMIELAPDAIALEELKVTVDRLERMRRASPMSSRTFTEDVLARSSYPNLLEFVTSYYGLTRVSCSILATSAGSECVRVRGTPRRPCVVIDEATAIGGFDALYTYHPQDVARVNVYAGGAFIQVYTTAFMRRAAQRRWTPMPVQAQMMAFCRFS